MIERLCRMIYLHLSLTIVGVHCLSIKVIYQATPVPSYRYLSLNAVPYEEIYSVILFNIILLNKIESNYKHEKRVP